MKRLYTALLACALLILALSGKLLLEERALRVSAQAESDQEREAKRDLLVLTLAYPGDITGVARGEDGLVYVQMKTGGKIVYDDLKQKSFEEQLACADLQDTMALPYPLKAIDTLRQGNDDPGRVRCYAFLHALYGDTQYGIEKNLVQANLVCGGYPVAAQAAPAFEAAFAQLAAYTRENPPAYPYVFPVGGTYNYRLIAGTGSLSPHAFGIAVDLKSNPCAGPHGSRGRRGWTITRRKRCGSWRAAVSSGAASGRTSTFCTSSTGRS
jgi:hypothetical protein